MRMNHLGWTPEVIPHVNLITGISSWANRTHLPLDPTYISMFIRYLSTWIHSLSTSYFTKNHLRVTVLLSCNTLVMSFLSWRTHHGILDLPGRSAHSPVPSDSATPIVACLCSEIDTGTIAGKPVTQDTCIVWASVLRSLTFWPFPAGTETHRTYSFCFQRWQQYSHTLIQFYCCHKPSSTIYIAGT